MADQPVFYYDLGSAASSVVAELSASSLPEQPEWEPVVGADLGIAVGEIDRAAIERLAREHELQPMRWPEEWPPDTRQATLAATYAKQIGRTVSFSLAAFRQAFAGGRDLGDEDTVLIAAAACEMHPAAVLKGIELRSVAKALDDAVARARAAGIDSLPAIGVGDEVFSGRDALRDAAAAIGAQA
jgi:2-hydroxychromene-2-carboxylate isomerase